MHNTLKYLFPTTLRLDRQKNKFDNIAIPITLVFLIVFFCYSHFFLKFSILQSVLHALKKTLLAYVTYLIMVELSPDTAHIFRWSYILIGIVLIPMTILHLMAGIFFLFTTRLLTKSSGYLSSIPELFLMLIFTVIAYFFSPFLYPLLFGIALLLDYKFKHRDSRNLPFIVISALMSLLWISTGFGIMTSKLNLLPTLTVCIIGISYIFRLALLKSVLSFNDIETNLISPKRVKAAGLLLLMSLIFFAIGHAMVFEFANIWVMLACISFPFLKDLKHVISG